MWFNFAVIPAVKRVKFMVCVESNHLFSLLPHVTGSNIEYAFTFILRQQVIWFGM